MFVSSLLLLALRSDNSIVMYSPILFHGNTLFRLRSSLKPWRLVELYALHSEWESWYPNNATSSISDSPSWLDRSSSANNSTSKQDTIGDLATLEIPEPRRMYLDGGASYWNSLPDGDNMLIVNVLMNLYPKKHDQATLEIFLKI